MSTASGVPLAGRGTLAEQAFLRLRDELQWEEVAPGDWLRENEVAERLGISRTPVREALRRLESEGYLQRRGASLIAADFDFDYAIETLTLRELLEPFAAVESVKRYGTSDVLQLRALVAQMNSIAQAGPEEFDPRIAAELDLTFHRRLNAHCPQRRILRIIERARDSHSLLRLYRHYSPAERLRVQQDHEGIVDIATRGSLDADGERELRSGIADHLTSARESIHLLLGEPARPSPGPFQ